METTPLDLIEDQYNAAMYGVSENGDMWLLYSTFTNDDMDACHWLGNDPDAWDNLLNEVSAESCESTVVSVDGEDLNTIACRVGDRTIQLDLDGLRNGRVIWWSAM